jgi:peptide/nickel transport system substrate-binding protein
VNALLNELAPWVFLHQQYSIYGISDELEWEPRQDEDILARHISGS